MAALTGHIKNVPLLAREFALDHDVTVSGAATLDPKKLLPTGGHAEIPLSGVSLAELRVLLKSTTQAKDETKEK